MRCSCSRIRSDRLLRRVVVLDRHRCLQHDGAGIELRRHEVHRGARQLSLRGRRTCCCASSPGKAGSSEGWMLSTALGNARMKSALSRRMNPARQTSVTPRSFNVDASTRSCATRSGYALCEMTSVPMPRAAGPLQARGLRTVRDHDGDPRVEAAAGHGVDDCLQVAAATRDEHPYRGLVDILDRARSSHDAPDGEAAPRRRWRAAWQAPPARAVPRSRRSCRCPC